MARQTIRTVENRTAFLETLARSGNVTGSCDLVGLGRASLYEWREEDPTFAAAWDAALQRGVDALEDEAIRRAMSGSDLLLIFLLKANRPDKYRETRHVSIDQRLAIDYRGLSPDELRQRLAELRQRQDSDAIGPLIEGSAITEEDQS